MDPFDQKVIDGHGVTQPIDRRTVYARALLRVLQQPVGIETLDWELADAAMSVADIEIER